MGTLWNCLNGAKITKTTLNNCPSCWNINILKCNNHHSLIFASWVKISADDNLKYFPYFSQKVGFNISNKLDNLPEMLYPIFWGIKEK